MRNHLTTCAMLAALLTLTGCATSRWPAIDLVSAEPNCQDYSNAWAREANRRGIRAGVVHYTTVQRQEEGRPGHAVCWAQPWIGPDAGDYVFFEPQGMHPRRIPNPDTIEGFVLWAWSYGPMLSGINALRDNGEYPRTGGRE